VQPHRETKSMGAEDTFAYDLTTLEEMNAELEKIAKLVHERLLKYQLKGRTITLKIKYSDFRQITRSQSFSYCLDDLATITTTAQNLMASVYTDAARIRLLGITVSNFNPIESKTPPKTDQLSIFDQ